MVHCVIASLTRDSVPGIVLRDGFEELGVGLEGTAQNQAREFVRILRKETARSQVMRDLITTIVATAGKTKKPVILYFGR